MEYPKAIYKKANVGDKDTLTFNGALLCSLIVNTKEEEAEALKHGYYNHPSLVNIESKVVFSSYNKSIPVHYEYPKIMFKEDSVSSMRSMIKGVSVVQFTVNSETEELEARGKGYIDYKEIGIPKEENPASSQSIVEPDNTEDVSDLDAETEEEEPASQKRRGRPRIK